MGTDQVKFIHKIQDIQSKLLNNGTDFTYIDLFGGINNFWYYPYKLFPFFATCFSLDVSVIPMLYMFVYQWT
jgi:hypothetical protein